MKKEKIEFSVSNEMILKGAYWILMKFNADKFHRGLDSAKRDKFGGYLERWMNKVFEKPFFDTLLKKYNKDYSVIYDDLIYKDVKLKTAPDVLGLKTKNSLIPFGKYENDWQHFKKMPKIEIKSYRNDHYVATTKVDQIADYYVFLKHDLDDDYLKTIFTENFYNDKNYDEITKNWDKLKVLYGNNKNILTNIQKPINKLEKFNVELLSIMTGEDWKKFSKIAKGAEKESNRIKKKPEAPFYFKKIEENTVKHWSSRKNPLGNKDLNNLNLDDELMKKNVLEEEKKYLMPVFENLNIDQSNKVIADITGSSGSTLYFSKKEKFKLNGQIYSGGDYKMSFVIFDRSAGFDEHCALKDSVFLFDKREKLLNEFDEIVKKI